MHLFAPNFTMSVAAWQQTTSENTMNPVNPEEPRPEYDFSQGVRGKHYRAMQQAYTVTVHQADGSRLVQTIQAPPGVVVLEEDVRAYFPDSASVNEALRALIRLIPKQPLGSG